MITLFTSRSSRSSIWIRAAAPAGLFLGLVMDASSARAATYTVDSTGDAADATPGDGLCATAGAVCTLRAAIQEANADATKDTIAFGIAGAGPHVIKPSTVLPPLDEPVNIDGYTQAGAKANTKRFPELTDAVIKIAIDGSLAPISGANNTAFRIEGGGSLIRGLSIYKWLGTNGGRIVIDSDNNVIEGNYIGLDTAGLESPEGLTDNASEPAWTGNGIIVQSGVNNLIGGTTDGARNVIANAWRYAIYFAPGTGGTVSGNFIGVDKTGLTVPDTDDNVPPYTAGIHLNEADAVVIGGDTWSKKNVICARSVNAEAIRIDATDNALVRSNYLNWYADGNTPCGTGSDGVFVGSGSTGVVITENSISAQSNKRGLYLNQAYDAEITDNTVGVSFDGDAVSSASGANTAGIALSRADDCLIQGNTIAILYTGILFLSEASTGTRIVGNFIGTDSSGTKSFFNNNSYGVQVLDVSGATIGGTGDGEGNLIRGGNAGVFLTAISGEIVMLRNAIWDQIGPQIDLFPVGVTENDMGDFDSGANSRQNTVVLDEAQFLIDRLVVTGALNSSATSSYRVEFFASPEESNVVTGPAFRYLGSTNVLTDDAGDAEISAEFDGEVAIGEFVTATVTLCADEGCTEFVETSEVSGRVAVTGCRRDNECSGDVPVCNNKTGICVECSTRTDCAESLICDKEAGKCTGCENDAQCAIGDVCNEDSRCELPKAPSAGGCGCALGNGSGSTGLEDAWLPLLALGWLAFRRRRATSCRATRVPATRVPA